MQINHNCINNKLCYFRKKIFVNFHGMKGITISLIRSFLFQFRMNEAISEMIRVKNEISFFFFFTFFFGEQATRALDV